METEGPAAQTGEPRIPVRVQQEPGRSQSPHNSDEAGNDRGAKEGRQVEAGRKYNCKSNCRECRRLNQAERCPPNGKGPKQRCGPNAGLASLERGIKERTRKRPSEMAPCLLRRTGVNLLSFNPSQSGQCSPRDPLTGKPDAGKPPVRFGGRGRGQPPVPTPIRVEHADYSRARRSSRWKINSFGRRACSFMNSSSCMTISRRHSSS